MMFRLGRSPCPDPRRDRALNLSVAGAADASPALLRRQTGLSALGVGALILLYAFDRVAPPLVTLVAVEALFLLSLAKRPH